MAVDVDRKCVEQSCAPETSEEVCFSLDVVGVACGVGVKAVSVKYKGLRLNIVTVMLT